MTNKNVRCAFWVLLLISCGGSTSQRESSRGGDSLPCRSDSCGEARFRNAVPTRSVVRIDFGSHAQKGDDVGRRTDALRDISPYYELTENYVDEINRVVDAVFDSLEFAAGGTPIEEEDSHVWREARDGMDVVLDIEEIEVGHYSLQYYEGPANFEVSGAFSLIEGMVSLNEDDTLSKFELQIQLEHLYDSNSSGQLLIAASSFSSGEFEVVFDLIDASFEGESPQTSQTTYWIFGDNDYALEYLGEFEGEQSTVYVRWDEIGGRFDSHVAYEDEELGYVDYIITNCWDHGASELFLGEALIDQAFDFYGELDGHEEDCHFGPLADHPHPGSDFENLPREGEWQTIDFIGCDPESEVCDDECDPESEVCDDECDPDFEICDEEEW